MAPKKLSNCSTADYHGVQNNSDIPDFDKAQALLGNALFKPYSRCMPLLTLTHVACRIQKGIPKGSTERHYDDAGDDASDDEYPSDDDASDDDASDDEAPSDNDSSYTAKKLNIPARMRRTSSEAPASRKKQKMTRISLASKAQAPQEYVHNVGTCSLIHSMIITVSSNLHAIYRSFRPPCPNVAHQKIGCISVLIVICLQI
jgi:hypothetical protein